MRLTTACAGAVILALTGCGDDEPDRPRLTVAAASSLKGAFEEYGESFHRAGARFSFAGSDDLAAQIRQGVRPDVYAAANIRLPARLFQAELVERPVVFARNRLVIAAPADGEVDSLADLAAEDVALAIGTESAPVGSYAREVLSRLAPARRRAILANVRSEERDASGIVAKLVQGAADAGFVYATDVAAAGPRLKQVELPARLEPEVEYGVAVVAGAKRPEARAFIDGLRHGDGRRAMRRAGFLLPR